jgi:hypothetical protein
MPGSSRLDNVKLFELARWLADDASLTQEITLAVERPGDYVDRFAERLRYRGITKRRFDASGLPWIALVDGLAERKRLGEIDAKSPGDQTMEAMQTIVPDGDWAWLITDAWVEKRPHEVFAEIEARLAPQDLRLVAVDIFSDCYPLMALPTGKVAESRRLAELAGYGRIAPPLVLWFGEEPPGAEP